MDEELSEFEREIVAAIRSIACGGTTGPNGLEALTMAIGGVGAPGSGGSIAGELSGIAHALTDVADALRQISGAVEDILTPGSIGE